LFGQKRVMAMIAVHFAIFGLYAGGANCIGKFAYRRRREEPVGANAHKVQTRANPSEGLLGEAWPCSGSRFPWFAKWQIGVGVEAIDKATSLVVEIAADYRTGRQSVRHPGRRDRADLRRCDWGCGRTARRRAAPTCNSTWRFAAPGPNHAGLMLGKIMPVCPLRILLDRGALQVIQGDTHGRERSYSDDGSALDTLRLEDCPFQRLHTADRSAEDKRSFFDSERINEPGLGAHVVANGNQREVGAVGASRFGIEQTRPG